MHIWAYWYFSWQSCGEGNGTPLQYSCLENPMDWGAWWAAVHGITKSRTRLSDFTFTFHFHALEKEMATHSSVFAWRNPGMGQPGGLLSMGSHRVRHDWGDLAAAAAAAAYKLNNQGDTTQPWHTPFHIWNQSIVPCPVLTVASWPAYRFLRRQVRWSGIPISLRIFHSLLWSTQSKALA